MGSSSECSCPTSCPLNATKTSKPSANPVHVPLAPLGISCLCEGGLELAPPATFLFLLSTSEKFRQDFSVCLHRGAQARHETIACVWGKCDASLRPSAAEAGQDSTPCGASTAIQIPKTAGGRDIILRFRE